MAKLSKRQEYLSTLEERKYSVPEAIQFLKSGPKTNFEESVDVSINLGIDASKSDQTVRSATSLPAGTGKTCKVAVFAEAEQAKEALESGADAVGMEGIVHGRIGDLSYSSEQIQQNIETLLVDIKRNKPASSKGIFIQKLSLSSTMGAGIELDMGTLSF